MQVKVSYSGLRIQIAEFSSRRRTSLDLIQRSMSDYVIHSTSVIIGEVDSILSRTRALLAPAEPVPRILDNIDPFAKLAAKR